MKNDKKIREKSFAKEDSVMSEKQSHELLDAIGGIDPQYIVSAEADRKVRQRNAWRVVFPAAVCACVFLAMMAARKNEVVKQKNGQNGSSHMTVEQDTSSKGNVVESREESGDVAPFIRVNGKVYQDTYEIFHGSIRKKEIRKTVSYTDGFPAKDGEQNFSRTNISYVVLDENKIICDVEGGWYIFKKTESDSDNVSATDAPVDEETYSEAETYPEDILDLQNRISAAMGNGHELSFVTTSMILEDPVRIHVIVNSKEKSAIRLLKSYNTKGVNLEIEYSDDIGTEE